MKFRKRLEAVIDRFRAFCPTHQCLNIIISQTTLVVHSGSLFATVEIGSTIDQIDECITQLNQWLDREEGNKRLEEHLKPPRTPDAAPDIFQFRIPLDAIFTDEDSGRKIRVRIHNQRD